VGEVGFHKDRGRHTTSTARLIPLKSGGFAIDSPGIREFGQGVPHPRGYGTNARVLGKYVRELGVLSLEEAVRKMTSLPARTFGFRDRGQIREGFWADLVMFDPARVADRATFEQPHQYSVGFDWVLVNGVVVIEDGQPTTARPGSAEICRAACPGVGARRAAGSLHRRQSGRGRPAAQDRQSFSCGRPPVAPAARGPVDA